MAFLLIAQHMFVKVVNQHALLAQDLIIITVFHAQVLYISILRQNHVLIFVQMVLMQIRQIIYVHHATHFVQLAQDQTIIIVSLVQIHII